MCGTRWPPSKRLPFAPRIPPLKRGVLTLLRFGPLSLANITIVFPASPRASSVARMRPMFVSRFSTIAYSAAVFGSKPFVVYVAKRSSGACMGEWQALNGT